MLILSHPGHSHLSVDLLLQLDLLKFNKFSCTKSPVVPGDQHSNKLHFIAAFIHHKDRNHWNVPVLNPVPVSVASFQASLPGPPPSSIFPLEALSPPGWGPGEPFLWAGPCSQTSRRAASASRSDATTTSWALGNALSHPGACQTLPQR